MYKLLNFDRGRNCLKHLIKVFKVKELFIPYYLCDVIRHTLFEENCKPVFYHINDDFMPACDFHKNSFILYPNYFGICENNVKILERIYPKLIVDNAHAYYNPPLGIACFNSGIKFGYGENAYLWIKNTETMNSEYSIPVNREWQKKCRNKFIKLDKTYSGMNILKIKRRINYENCFPFCYPLLAENIQEADRIVKDLTQKGYTIYRYWNTMPESFNEYKFYSRLVPIPIAEVI